MIRKQLKRKIAGLTLLRMDISKDIAGMATYNNVIFKFYKMYY